MKILNNILTKISKERLGDKSRKSAIKRKKEKQKLRTDEIEIEKEIDTITSEELREAKFQKEYEQLFKGKHAIFRGKPTQEYLKWKKMIQDYQELHFDKLEEDIYVLTLREAIRERTSKIALEISKLFPYSRIKQAISGIDGLEVHGFIQENYDDYEELIKNDVLDKACYYAKRYYTPEMIKYLQDIDLDTLVKTKVELFREIELENYPTLSFRQAIIFAEEPLEKALTWLDQYPFLIDAYDVKVTLAPVNLALLGWNQWNIPVFLVLHVVGKNLGIMKAKVEAKKLANQMDTIKDKLIHQYRSYVEPLEDKMDELYRDKLQSKKQYDHLLQKIETEVPSDIIAEYEQMLKGKYYGREEGIGKRNWKNIGLIIFFLIMIGILISILFLIRTLLEPEVPYEEPPIETSSILINLLKVLLI